MDLDNSLIKKGMFWQDLSSKQFKIFQLIKYKLIDGLMKMMVEW